MKNLKRFLAVLVVVAVMVTSMIPAFAEGQQQGQTQGQQQQSQAPALDNPTICKTLEVLTGDGGDWDTYLTKDTTKMQAAIVLLKMLGKYDEAVAYTSATNFKDASKVTWASGRNILAYLKANPDLGWQGNPDGTFGVKDMATVQMLYKVMLQVLGYSYGEDFTWTATMSFAADHGLGASADVSTVKNSNLADILVESLGANVKDSEDTTLLKQMADANADFAAKAVEAGLMDGQGGGDQPAAEKPTSITAAAAGVSKVSVTFDKALSDTSAAKFTVKRGAYEMSVDSSKTVFSDDKKTATLTISGTITKGDYSVVVSGVADSDLTAPFSADDQKVTSIEISPNATLVSATDFSKVKVSYKVLNQYKEDITKTNNNLTFACSKSTSNVPGTGSDVGTVVFNVVSGMYFIQGEKITVSISSNDVPVLASKEIVVSGVPTVSELNIQENLYCSTDPNNSAKTPVLGESLSTYLLVFTAKDQYGNDLKATDLREGLTVFSSYSAVADVKRYLNTTKADFTTTNIGGVDKITLALTNTSATPQAGSTDLTFFSTSSGKSFTYKVKVADSVKIDQLTLQAPSIAVIGEKIEIPFVALDQAGNEIKSFKDINAYVNSSTTRVLNAQSTVNAVSLPITFVKDNATADGVKLILDATGANVKAGNVLITGMVGTNMTSYRSVSLTVNLLDRAKPVSMTIGGVTNTVYNGYAGSNKWGWAIKDQYGRNMDLDQYLGTSAGQFNLLFKSSDTNVIKVKSQSASESAAGATAVANSGGWPWIDLIGGTQKGSSTITVTLRAYTSTGIDPTVDISYSFQANNLDWKDIDHFGMKDFSGKMYEQGILGTNTDGSYVYYKNQWNNIQGMDIGVAGYLKDGSEVAIPDASKIVAVGDPNVVLDSNNKTLYSKAGYSGWGTNTERQVPVTVTIYGTNGVETYTKNVTISRETPKIDKISLCSSDSQLTSEDFKTKVNEGGNVLSDTLHGIFDKGIDNSWHFSGIPSSVTGNNPTLLAYVTDVLSSTDQYGKDVWSHPIDTLPTFNYTNWSTGTPEKYKLYVGINDGPVSLYAQGQTFDTQYWGKTKLNVGDVISVTATTESGISFSFKIKIRG